MGNLQCFGILRRELYGFALCFLTLSAMPVLASNLEEKGNPEHEGLKYLKSGDANKALERFNAAARERPDSVEAHYGRARALAMLGRKEEAIKEFKLTLLLKPVDELAALCRENLATLSGNTEGEHSVLPQGQTASSTVHPQDVEQSIDKILKQSEERIGLIHSHAESFATSIYNSRSDAHNRLMEQSRQEAEEMRSARVRRGRRMMPAFSEQEIMERQAELQYRSMSSLARARSDFENRRQEAESRALGVKESAEGLQSQMINKPSESSGVYLVPKGTNLYVRNYSHFDPVLPEPLEALHAVPLKLPQLLNADKARNKDSGSHSAEQSASGQ